MILFRADANENIGMGHVMRCLSIADAFSYLNQQSVFVVSRSTNADIIKKRGYEVVILDSDYNEMDKELVQLLSLIKDLLPRICIIDSYFVFKEYLGELKELVYTVYIDDLASFAYPVNCLLNYNIYGTEIDYDGLYKSSNIFPRFLLGTSYVPLRSEFVNVDNRKPQKNVKDVLISTGGSDQIHLALNLVGQIKNLNDSVNYHILVGSLNKDFEEIIRLSSGIDNIIVHHDVKNMLDLISSSDIAVSAAGSTMYEICRCGVPMVIYVLADNQLPGNELFRKNGIAISCGDLRNCINPSTIILNGVQKYIDDFELRETVSSKMKKMVDGKGAIRIAEKLLKDTIG